MSEADLGDGMGGRHGRASAFWEDLVQNTGQANPYGAKTPRKPWAVSLKFPGLSPLLLVKT